MTRVLLFGAYGYLGRQVQCALEADGRISDVVAYDRDRYEFVTGAFDELVELVRDAAPDAVVNCAGLLDGNAHELTLANTLVTAKLLDAVAVAAPGARVVRIGSAGEYGPMPYGSAVSEDAVARPASEYGLSHLAATGLVQLASDAGRVDGVVLRVFNPIGPGGNGANLLGRAVQRLSEAIDGGADHIEMGPLGAFRDFVDVRDVAAAVLAAVLASKVEHRILNVGSGNAVTCRHAVELLAAAAGFQGEIREAGGSSQRSAAVSWACADISRISQSLGWNPVHDLAASAKTIWAAR